MSLHGVLLSLFRGIAGIYFREVEVVGAPPKTTGARLFAANHVNGLIDPILVMTNAPFPIAPVAKSTLFKVPVLRSLLKAVDAVPVIRKKDDPTRPAGSNDDVFDKVAAHFGRGGNLLIFPEGVSHNEPHVVALKTGPARMLARAHKLGVKGLTFQTVALEFDARDTFRSRALVLFGPVREVDALGVEAEALVAKISEIIHDDLTELVVEGASWDDRLLIARVAELLTHESGDRSLAAWNEIGRQVEAARKALKDHEAPLYREVSEAVTTYYDRLAASGVREDHLVAGAEGKGAPMGGTLLMVLLAPLALVGCVLYFLPYQLPRLAHRLAKDEHDVVSTYKLGIGLVAHPVWAASLITTALLMLRAHPNRVPMSIVAVSLVLLAPFAALAWLERLHPVRAAWSLTRRTTGLDELRASRKRAIDTIQSARAKLGLAAIAVVALLGCGGAPGAIDDAIDVTAGAQHTCVRHRDRHVSCWGANGGGQIGSLRRSDEPLRFTAVPQLDKALRLGAGRASTCALRDGAVLCWGENEHGQVGKGVFTPFELAPAIATTTTIDLALRDTHACVRLVDRTVRCWGAGAHYALGDGSTLDRARPVTVIGLAPVKSIAVGHESSCAVLDDGTVKCWGSNEHGRLGDGSEADRSLPTLVPGLNEVADVALGAEHACALRNDGRVWCWGRLDEETTSLRPVPIVGIVGVTLLTLGQAHTCALRVDGRVWCWGKNDRGQLGDGTRTDRSVPQPVNGVTDVIQVSAGTNHVCAVTRDHRVWCWGANDSGQLGDGGRSDSPLPRPALR